jgi:mRNA interferase RelE/StbE
LAYKITIEKKALKFLSKLDFKPKKRISEVITSLAENPRPHGVKKLISRPGWRLRVSDYRLIYVIHDDILSVSVIDIDHRKNIYKR